MKTATTAALIPDPGNVLDRHAVRRAGGVPTVSLLVGPTSAGVRALRRWAKAAGRAIVVATGGCFPKGEWIRSVAQQVDLPAAAVRCVARRVGRDPDEFLLAWRARTAGDNDRLWGGLAPHTDDDVLQALAALLAGLDSTDGAAYLTALDDRAVTATLRLAPSTAWPEVLFVCGSTDQLATAAHEAASWAERAPVIPIAVAVAPPVWAAYLGAPADSRAKALLREGELTIPALDPGAVTQTLTGAGVDGRAAAAIAASGADDALVGAATAAARATAVAPQSESEDNRARSAAEQFLFEFLESLPETAGRFELNASLNFLFGPRPAEVDLLCREPPLAVEIDGYFHFLGPSGYRRDRGKDWELQRRGYLVLRFLAEDVIPQLEVIRDRILEAIARPLAGGPPWTTLSPPRPLP